MLAHWNGFGLQFVGLCLVGVAAAHEPFPACLRGPAVEHCAGYDHDRDGDVDLADYQSELRQLESEAASGPLPIGKRGTSVTFVKWQEVETRDDAGSHPLPTEIAVRNLAKYDAIWASMFIGRWNPEVWRELRTRFPTILALHYTSAVVTARTGPRGYFDYQYISQQHPEWILGVRMSINPASESYAHEFLDVCNPMFKLWAASHVASRASGEWDSMRPGYHGVALDNVQIGQRATAKLDARWPGWRYDGRANTWNACFLDYIRLVRRTLNAQGHQLFVNHGLEYGTDADRKLWPGLLTGADGLLSERPLGRLDEGLYVGDAWLAALERHERVMDAGLIDWWVMYPGERDWARAEDFLYAYASWLLVQRPGRSFFYASHGDPGYRTNPVVHWYPEYDRPLGVPVGCRYRRGECWARDYANGVVLVNPTREPQTVVVAGNVVRLVPMAGRILWFGCGAR